MSILTKTTLVSLLVDDPAVNNTYSEFLLQVQGGLPQGSFTIRIRLQHTWPFRSQSEFSAQSVLI